MDVWLYIQKEQLEIPSLYFSHDRVCIERGDMWLAHADCVGLKPGETPQSLRVRFRTIGDMTCTGAVLSEASTIEGIIDEVATSRISERGTRADDHRSSAAMEERKREGYF
jgi:sulfate adenylyltransferase subunit 2